MGYLWCIYAHLCGSVHVSVCVYMRVYAYCVCVYMYMFSVLCATCPLVCGQKVSFFWLHYLEIKRSTKGVSL